MQIAWINEETKENIFLKDSIIWNSSMGIAMSYSYLWFAGVSLTWIEGFY